MLRIFGVGFLLFAANGCGSLAAVETPPPKHHIVRRRNSRAHEQAIPVRTVPPGFVFVGSIDLEPTEDNVPALAAHYGADAYAINRNDPFGPGIYLFRARDWYVDAVASTTLQWITIISGTPTPLPPLLIRRLNVVIADENRANFDDPDEVQMAQPLDLQLSVFAIALGDTFAMGFLAPYGIHDSSISLGIYGRICRRLMELG